MKYYLGEKEFLVWVFQVMSVVKPLLSRIFCQKCVRLHILDWRKNCKENISVNLMYQQIFRSVQFDEVNSLHLLMVNISKWSFHHFDRNFLARLVFAVFDGLKKIISFQNQSWYKLTHEYLGIQYTYVGHFKNLLPVLSTRNFSIILITSIGSIEECRIISW